jgi:hypothetical protein
MTTERKPHVHAEVIKAWADGVEVQHWSTPREKWEDVANPSWFSNAKYRIKPQPKPEPVTWYQVVCKNDYGMFIPDGLFSSKTEAEFRGYTPLKLIPIYTEGEETE